MSELINHKEPIGAPIREHIRAIVEELQLDWLATPEKFTEEIDKKWRSLINDRVQAQAAELTTRENELLQQGVVDEILGFGPLGSLFRDPQIGKIYVNQYDAVYVQRNGRLEKTSVTFDSDKHLHRTIDKLVQPLGYRLDQDSPVINATLPNGSWLVATIPPISRNGTTLTIVCFATANMSFEQLVSRNVMSRPMADFLKDCVTGHVNIVISGTNDSGRTTLLNALSEHIGSQERTIAIEQENPIKLQQEHWVRLAVRPPGQDGKGEQSGGMLVNTALRMHPDRLILADCSAKDAFDFVNAINSGLRGSICTINATSPQNCLQRLELMIRMQYGQITPQEARELIGSALQLIIQLEKMEDGARRITKIAEITEIEDGAIKLNTLFELERKGLQPNGFLQCDFVSSGIRPKFVTQLEK